MRASTQEVTKPFAYDFEVSLYPTHIPKSPYPNCPHLPVWKAPAELAWVKGQRTVQVVE